MSGSILKRNKSFLGIVALVVLGILFGLIVFGKLYKNMQRRIDQITQKIKIADGEAKRKSMMMKEVNAFKTEQLGIESKTLAFSGYVPYKVDTTKFVKLLQGFSDQYSSDYRLKNMKVEIVPLKKIADHYYSRQFRIYCQGKYQDVIKFFGILQKAKYLLNIEEIEIRRNPDIVPWVETDFRISIIQSSSEE